MTGILNGILALVLATPLSALTITEINYYPGGEVDPTADEPTAYIEIYNEGSIALDMSGFAFVEGISFVFPDGYLLASRTYVVLAANAEALKAAYDLELRNVIGDYTGKLDNGGERLRLVNHTGSPVIDVRYDDRGRWPAAADGTGYTLTLRKPLLDVRKPESWVRSAQRGGTPGKENFSPPVFFDVPVLPAEQIWKYRKAYDPETQMPAEFSDPPEAWRAFDFDDSTWPEGTAPIGFGASEIRDGIIKTELADMEDNYFAFAMRRKFTIEADQIEGGVSLILNARIDDGAIFWLNGEEVARIGVSGSRGAEAPIDIKANKTNEIDEVQDVALQLDSVRVGENVLAVQVHNRTLGSSDAGFDTAFSCRRIQTFEPPPTPTVVFNEVTRSDSVNERWIELYNLTNKPIDLSGHWITGTPTGEEGPPQSGYLFPDGTDIPAQGFLFVTEGDLGFSLLLDEVAVYLYSPDGNNLIDAATVSTATEPSPSSRSRLPDGTGRWETSAILTAGKPNDVDLETGVVINEIHYNPLLAGDDGAPLTDTSKGEYIELFNTTDDRVISLDGFRLNSGYQFEFGPEQQITPGGYLVVARDPEYIKETYGLDDTVVVGLSQEATPEERDRFGVLANGGERIRLVDGRGNVVDEVRYFDDGEWYPFADGGGSSLELVDPFQDNGVGSAWWGSDESTKAPWFDLNYEANYPRRLLPGTLEPEMHLLLLGAGETLIDDVSLKKPGSDSNLISNGDFERTTTPWRITGNHIYSERTEEEAKVGNASLRLVSTGTGNNRPNHVETDTVRIMPGPIEIHLWARWVKGVNGLHVSGHNNAYGNTVWLPIPAQTGTPGAENSARIALREASGDDNLGPVISEVRHDPAVPNPNSPVHFHAKVQDADGVESVTVHYHETDPNEIRHVTLRDDGASGDGFAGDGHFAGSMLGFSEKTVVSFWVSARDGEAKVNAFPAGADEEITKRRVFIADEQKESLIHRHRLVIAPRTTSFLRKRQLHSNDLVKGTFIFEEDTIHYNVGFRYHGSPWNRPPNPRMFRARFDSENKFRHTVKRFNISRYGFNQHEGMAYQLFRKASVPGHVVPHTASYEYAEVILNQRLHSGRGGAMAEIRAVDSVYADYNWPQDSDGQVYKITAKIAFSDSGTHTVDWAQFRLYTQGVVDGTPSKENHRYYYTPKTRKNLDRYEPLLRLLKVVDRSTPGAELVEQLDSVMNVEAFLRTFIIRILQDDWDTIDIGNGQNSYLYYAPIEGRFYLCPWDMDHTFANSNARMEPQSTRIGLGRVVSTMKYRRLYANIMNDIAQDAWSLEHFRQYTTAVAANTRGLASPGQILGFIRGRRNYIERFLRPGGAAFRIITPSPAFTPGETITIEGTAPIEVRTIVATVNDGDPVMLHPEWKGSSRSIPTRFDVEISGIGPEKSTVDLLAFSRVGELVDSASIEVQNTAGWEAPQATGIEPTVGFIAGGTEVTITGANFRHGAGVTFGETEAPELEVVSPTEIRVLTPEHEAGVVDVIVSNGDQQQSVLEQSFTFADASFIRGDANNDGRLSISDAVRILKMLFAGEEHLCADATDVDDNGATNVTDAIVLLDYLYGRGTAPPSAPFPDRGPDLTEDGLSCGL